MPIAVSDGQVFVKTTERNEAPKYDKAYYAGCFVAASFKQLIQTQTCRATRMDLPKGESEVAVFSAKRWDRRNS